MNNKIEMKMKKNQLTMLVLFVTMLGFTACSDDDGPKIPEGPIAPVNGAYVINTGAATDRWNLYF